MELSRLEFEKELRLVTSCNSLSDITNTTPITRPDSQTSSFSFSVSQSNASDKPMSLLKESDLNTKSAESVHLPETSLLLDLPTSSAQTAAALTLDELATSQEACFLPVSRVGTLLFSTDGLHCFALGESTKSSFRKLGTQILGGFTLFQSVEAAKQCPGTASALPLTGVLKVQPGGERVAGTRCSEVTPVALFE